MFKKLLVIATLAAGLISTQASAAFVATDWKTIGDKNATLDTSTGLEWLDFRFTTTKSFETVVSELSTSFKGWRLPTTSEVQALMVGYWGEVALSGRVRNSTTGWAGKLSFENLFFRGSSYYRGESGLFTGGRYLDESGLLRVAGSFYCQCGTSYHDLYGMSYPTIYSKEQSVVTMVNTTNTGYRTGVWLVSDGGTTLSSINDPTININNPNAPINMADVSAPLGLAGAGLLMLMLGARRKAV